MRLFLSLLCVWSLHGSRISAEPGSCTSLSRLTRAAAYAWAGDLRSSRLYRLLDHVRLAKYLKANEAKAIEAYAEKVRVFTNNAASAGSGSDAYHEQLYKLFQEGAALAQESTIKLLPALAEAYVQARHENGPFWKSRPPIVASKDWTDLVARAEGDYQGKRNRRSQQFAAADLGARYSDPFEVVEDASINVYLAGAQAYSTRVMGQKLVGDVQKYRDLAQRTGDTGYFRDAANVISILQKTGFKVDVPSELQDMVVQARKKAFTDTPMHALDQLMKSVAQGMELEGGQHFGVGEWMKQFEEHFNTTGKIPPEYEAMVAGSVVSTDGTHGEVMILRHPSSGIHAFFEVDRSGGTVKLSGRSEALVERATKDVFFKNGEETKSRECAGCHNGAVPRYNHGAIGSIGEDTGGPFEY